MGTRHLQTVITKEGKKVISQYGQWDGYPSGQGVEILRYLKSGDLTKYQANLVKIKEVSDKEAKKIEAEIEEDETLYNKAGKYFHFNRDCGSQIHQLIEDRKVKNVQLAVEEDANKWCEGFYTIDFKENCFKSECRSTIKSYQLDNLPTEEQYLIDMEGSHH